MYSFNLLRSSLWLTYRNQLKLCRGTHVSFAEKRRKEMLDKFDYTNAEVFTKLKHKYSGQSEINWEKIKKSIVKEYPSVYNQFNFEVQFMQHIIKAKESGSLHLTNNKLVDSFREHVKVLLANHKNKVVQCHLIRFLLEIDPYPDQPFIKSALLDCSHDENFNKYPVIGKAWAEYAKLSPETAKEAVDFTSKQLILRSDSFETLMVNILKHGLFDQALFLAESYDKIKLSDNIVEVWMNALKTHVTSNTSKNVEQFVKVLHDKRYLFQKTMKSKLENFIFKIGYNCKSSTIDIEACRCTNCNQALETLQDHECEILRKAVKSYLVKKDTDIYLISTPEEVNKFYSFIDKEKPFDLVIDGLNISYFTTSRYLHEDEATKKISVSLLGLKENLYDTIKLNNILMRFKKILVIGRKHMANWISIKKLKEQFGGQVKVYLLDNKSEDDVFAIYAALQDKRTYIWTADFFRDYKSSLTSDYAGFFEKWKNCRQIRFVAGSKKLLEFPQNVDYVCQVAPDGRLHFPINMNLKVDAEERTVAHWICAGKPLQRR